MSGGVSVAVVVAVVVAEALDDDAPAPVLEASFAGCPPPHATIAPVVTAAPNAMRAARPSLFDGTGGGFVSIASVASQNGQRVSSART